jgi:hypothetical protein
LEALHVPFALLTVVIPESDCKADGKRRLNLVRITAIGVEEDEPIEQWRNVGHIRNAFGEDAQQSAVFLLGEEKLKKN